MENGFKKDIGEESLTEEKQQQLQQAIKDGKITFFVAKRGYRAVGMCSAVKCGSASERGMYGDLYVEPAFRKKGIARALTQAAREWCGQEGLACLTVRCGSCDAELFRALGFAPCPDGTWAQRI